MNINLNINDNIIEMSIQSLMNVAYIGVSETVF